MYESRLNEFVELAQQAFLKAMEINEALAGWESFDCPEGIFCHKKKLESKQYRKFQFYVDGEAGEIANYMFDNYVEFHNEISGPALKELSLIHKYENIKAMISYLAL